MTLLPDTAGGASETWLGMRWAFPTGSVALPICGAHVGCCKSHSRCCRLSLHPNSSDMDRSSDGAPWFEARREEPGRHGKSSAARLLPSAIRGECLGACVTERRESIRTLEREGLISRPVRLLTAPCRRGRLLRLCKPKRPQATPMVVSSCLVGETVLVIAVESCFGRTASCHQGHLWCPSCRDIQCTIDAPRHRTASITGRGDGSWGAASNGLVAPAGAPGRGVVCGVWCVVYSTRAHPARAAGRGLLLHPLA